MLNSSSSESIPNPTPLSNFFSALTFFSLYFLNCWSSLCLSSSVYRFKISFYISTRSSYTSESSCFSSSGSSTGYSSSSNSRSWSSSSASSIYSSYSSSLSSTSSSSTSASSSTTSPFYFFYFQTWCLILLFHFNNWSISLLPKTWISESSSSRSGGGLANEVYFCNCSLDKDILLYSMNTGKGLSMVRNSSKGRVL